MPRGDRTGPMGMGPRTGRAMGYCAGYDRPGSMQGGPGFAPGMGYGVGFGRGRGWRNWARATGLPRWMRFGADWAAPAPVEEADALKAQADALKAELDAIQKRLDEISKG